MSDLTYKILNTDGTITVYDKAAEIDSQLTAILTKTDNLTVSDVDVLGYAGIIAGGYHAADSGLWVANAEYTSTGFIRVKPNDVYRVLSTTTTIGHIVYWTKNKTFVSGIAAPTKVNNVVTITVPSTSTIVYMTFLTTNAQVASLKVYMSFIDSSKYISASDIFELDGQAIGLQWKNKTWFAFGTSITNTAAGHGKYIPYLSRLSGMTLTNYAVDGGTTFYNTHAALTTYNFALADLITIEGSVNDWAGNVPLGSVGDTVNYDGESTGTFAGAMYQCIKNAIERSTCATVVVVTDHVGRYVASTGGNCAPDTLNTINLKQMDYIKMMVDVAKYMGVPCIEAGQKCGINLLTPAYFATDDHIHHSEAGGRQYANAIWDELKHIHPRTIF